MLFAGSSPPATLASRRRIKLTNLHSLPWPRFCYLEIPAADPRKSAQFYKDVFGWNIRRGDSERPSFDDPNGISGAFVRYLQPAGPGILPSIWVKGIDSYVEKIVTHGGDIVERPRPDEPGGTCYIATFRDPGGNTLRIYQEAGE